MSGAVVVTGAASGIGRACASRLAAEGRPVLAIDINATGLAELAAEYDSVLTAVVDVRDGPGLQNLVERAAQQTGSVEALIAAAGVEVDAPVDRLSEKDWDQVVDINLKGTFLSVRAVLPHLRRARSGTLVTFGSVLGRAAMPGVTAYGASKAGIEALTRTLAIDYAHDGIRAVCVVPGTTDTPLTWAAVAPGDLATAKREAAAEVPLGFVADPDLIAQATVFALSPAAAFITGSALVVDGGLLARIAASH